MARTDLNVRFDGPGVADGVPLDDWHNTLQHVQTALRLMVGYLSGNPNQRGRPSNVVRQQSMLRLRTTKPGSLVAELALAPPSESQATLENCNSSRLRGRVGLQSKFRAWLPLCEKPDGP